MSGYEPELWSDFGVAVAGATAALAGLLFVAVSINLGRILAFPQLPTLAAAALVHLATALFAAVFLLIPQSTAALGFELAVEGLVVGLVLIPAHLRWRPTEYEGRVQLVVSRVLPSVLVPLLLLLAGIGVAQQVLGGLYLLAAAVVVSVLTALGYAWVLLVEIQR
jgi:modulator of FtsH protease